MADLESILKSQYSDYNSTLKVTSFDKENKEYLCKNNIQVVYDFDEIVKKMYLLKQPSSYDALLVNDSHIYCIEFKNQKYSDIKNEIIHKKLMNGREVLDNIFSENNLSIRKYKFTYCVIYKNSVDKWRRGITKNIIQFNLEQYIGKYFNEIYTNDVDWFRLEYKKKFKKELTC